MTFGQLAVAVLFGQRSVPTSFGVGLYLEGQELAVPGYQRATVRQADWSVDGNQAKTTVEFGPFRQRIRFDEVWLTLAGERMLRLDQMDGDDVVSLPAGIRFVDDVEVQLHGESD